jgi:predicted nucleotidyltransferase
MLTNEMKTDLIQGMLEIFGNNVEQIILYGSVARSEEKPESDIDIAVVVYEKPDASTRDRFITWAADMDLRYERVFSVIDIEYTYMRQWKDTLPFYRNIQQEGVVLWKAA